MLFYSKKLYLCSGEMAEWSIAAVLKTVVQQCTGGSNPSFSAEIKRLQQSLLFFKFTFCFNRRDARVVEWGGLENR